MATTKHSTVVGVFESHNQAQQAVDELRRVGFREDDIGVAARDGDAVQGATTTSKGSKVAAGAATGAAAGAGIGGLVGLGILAGVIPVIGPAIAGGTLAVILANAAGGAVIAGLAGALVGMGIPEEDAQYYENEFKSGRIILTVKADNRYDQAFEILRSHGAYNMKNPRVTHTGSGISDYSMSSVAGTKGAVGATGRPEGGRKL